MPNKKLENNNFHNLLTINPKKDLINKSNNEQVNQRNEKNCQNKELIEAISHISTDAEFSPVTDNPTIPLVVTFGTTNKDGVAAKTGEYIHPNHPYSPDELTKINQSILALGESENTFRVFSQDIAILDFIKDGYGIESRKLQGKRKKTFTISLYIFFSFKDIEFLFANNGYYRNEILPQLSRIRRITTPFGKPICLDYEICLPTSRGRMEWHALSINLVDICAMQGAKGLETYMINVGLSTNDKKLYSKTDKADMRSRLLENPGKFLQYIRSDVSLVQIFLKTNEFYNKIAKLIGVDKREEWGLSTGKIVASMVSEWVANKCGLPITDTLGKIEDSNGIEREAKGAGFYQYTRLGSPEAAKQMSHLTGLKSILYLGMTDGGRCVKERPHIHHLDGCLIDIDIASCYANGLFNQIFPVGNPKILFKTMKWGDWEKRYKKQLVPGAWVARVTWLNAPFRQDLLISKDDKQFTKWDFYQRQFNGENASDADMQYDATMYLMADDVKHAALTHDLYQVIDKYASNSEKAWIRENAVIECFAFYPASEEVETLDEDILIIDDLESHKGTGFSAITKWQRVELAELMETLIPERQKHKDTMKAVLKKYAAQIATVKTEQGIKNDDDALALILPELELSDYLTARSTQEFIKLINNTIYGCIASTFFGTNGTGISNFIVGNNITARARTLAWAMAKGLHSVMSVTDGGVFDLNNVINFREKSLGIFEGLSRDIFTDGKRNKTVEVIPLYDHLISQSELKDAVNGTNGFVKVEVKSWEHLTNQFGELDIFSSKQFEFEVKKSYTQLQIRNKSDYRLVNEITNETTIRVRGLKQNGSNVEVMIFDDIQNGENNCHHYSGSELLGLSDFRENRSTYQKLLPHDQISTEMSYYSFTPLGKRFLNEEHRNTVLRLYDEHKMTNDPKTLLTLTLLEDDEDPSKIMAEVKRLRKKKRQLKS